MIRKRYVFYGRVQGVGFRYWAKHAAKMFGVTGWVRNEYDGSVTMEVQGNEEQIRRVVEALDGDRYIEIDRFEVQAVPLESGERSFRTTW